MLFTKYSGFFMLYIALMKYNKQGQKIIILISKKGEF